MASSTAGGHCFFLLVALSLLSSAAYGQQLSEQYYSTKCPSLDKIIEKEVENTLYTDRRMGASLLRLFFHDCFVQGCDASVLLDDDVTKLIVSEKAARPNANSLRGFEVIDRIKDKVEEACGLRSVSCADILALATRQAVVALGGPAWPLLLGRRDSTTANRAEADTALPSPSSELPALIEAFRKKGFTDRELVALSGAHTVGMAQCGNVDQTQQQRCSNAINNIALLPLDEQSPEKFDNLYYKNLLPPGNRGLLHSDRVLVDRSDLKDLVEQYASNKNSSLFFQDFAKAMKKMSEMGVLTGANGGEIRSNCRRVNYY